MKAPIEEMDREALIRLNQILLNMFAPRKTAENPPTMKEHGGKSIMAWDAEFMSWQRHISISVINRNPDQYPYWMPMPPDPRMYENGN